MKFIVTVKLPKNKEHDPHNKKTGPCPVNGETCTDVTGEHHSFLVELEGGVAATRDYVTNGLGHKRITRIESVG